MNQNNSKLYCLLDIALPPFSVVLVEIYIRCVIVLSSINRSIFYIVIHCAVLGANLRRTLMLSPGQQDTQTRVAQTAAATSTEIEQAVSDQEKTNQACMKISFERYVNQIVYSTDREAHEERVKKITEVARNLSKDEWMFKPVSQLKKNT